MWFTAKAADIDDGNDDDDDGVVIIVCSLYRLGPVCNMEKTTKTPSHFPL